MRARTPWSWRCCWWPRRRPAPRWSCRAGFTAQVYVSGEGFDGTRVGHRHPVHARRSPSTPTGILYLARSGGATRAGEVEDVWPMFRIPLGGADGCKRDRGAFPLRSAAAQSSGRRHSRGPRAAGDDVRSRSRPGRALSHRGRSRRDGGRRHTRRAGRTAAPEAAGGRGARSPPAICTWPTGRRTRCVQLDPAGRVLNPRGSR